MALGGIEQAGQGKEESGEVCENEMIESFEEGIGKWRLEQE